MLSFLKKVLNIDEDGVRRVPKSNLAFRRSNGVDAFKMTHGMSMTEGQREAKPFVEEIVSHVSPRVVILEGITPLDAFRRRLCLGSAGQDIGESIVAKHRGQQVRIFHAQALHVRCLRREIPVIAIGHPSHFGSKPEFASVACSAADIVAMA